VRTSSIKDPLHLTLTPQAGVEVARDLSGGLEVFGQGWLAKDDGVSAVGGLRLRF